MSDYEDPIVKNLRSTGRFSPDASDDEIWESYVTHAVPLFSRDQRKLAIEHIDSYLGGDNAEKVLHVSRDSAKLLQKRRDLIAADAMLWRAGR